SSGMTSWNVVSFEMKLSERKKPSGSEKSVTSFQNARSDSCLGRLSAATRSRGPNSATPDRLKSAVMTTKTWRRRSIMRCGHFAARRLSIDLIRAENLRNHSRCHRPHAHGAAESHHARPCEGDGAGQA